MATMDEERFDGRSTDRAEEGTAEQPGDRPGRLKEELAAYHAELQAQDEELRRAYEQLEESRNRYFQLYESAPIGYLVIDQHGVIREINSTAAHLLGTSQDLLEGHLLSASVCSDDLRSLLRHQDEARRTEEQVTAELQLHKPDGKAVHVLMSTRRIGALFAPGELLVTLTDITRLKMTEARLREAERKLRLAHRATTVELDLTQQQLKRETRERSAAVSALRMTERQYEALVEHAGEGIIVTQDGKFRFVNQQVSEILGWSAEELLKMEFIRFVHPEDRRMVAERHVRRIQGEEMPSPYHMRIVDKRNRVRWVRNNAVVIDWEGRPGVLSLLTDITNEKELAKRLVEEREFLRTILENIPVMVVMYDCDGKVLLVNRAFREVIGWGKGDLDGAVIMDVLYPNRNERQAARDFLLSHAGEWRDVSLSCRDGGTVSASWTTVQLGDGRFIGLGVDNRELKRTEQELQAAYVRLEAEHAALERKNITLREVLAMFEKKRTEVKESVALNIDKAIMPKLRKIKRRAMKDATLCRQIEVLEGELAEIASPLMSRLKLKFGDLTPREQQVARMIARGIGTHEIARLLGLSMLTVQKHRELIRKRLGLTGSRTNLESYLRTLGSELAEEGEQAGEVKGGK